jgi:hypothetical protein
MLEPAGANVNMPKATSPETIIRQERSVRRAGGLHDERMARRRHSAHQVCLHTRARILPKFDTRALYSSHQAHHEPLPCHQSYISFGQPRKSAYLRPFQTPSTAITTTQLRPTPSQHHACSMPYPTPAYPCRHNHVLKIPTSPSRRHRESPACNAKSYRIAQVMPTTARPHGGLVDRARW